MERFVDYITTDSSMKNRLLIAHNGGRSVISTTKIQLPLRYDHHLIFHPLIRRNIYPKLILKGTGIMNACFNPPAGSKLNKLVLKDTVLLIPCPLANFRKAFNLDVDDKGNFPHML